MSSSQRSTTTPGFPGSARVPISGLHRRSEYETAIFEQDWRDLMAAFVAHRMVPETMRLELGISDSVASATMYEMTKRYERAFEELMHRLTDIYEMGNGLEALDFIARVTNAHYGKKAEKIG